MTHLVDPVIGISGKPDALHFLQVIRGLASVGVVCYHAAFDKTGSAGVGWWLSWGFSGVQIFFVLSGFIICLIHYGDIGQPMRASRYMYKRFVRIFPVYWVVLLIGAVFFTAGSKGFSWYFVAENVSLLKITNHEKLISVAWTLSHEILFYLVFLVFVLSRHLGLMVAAIWAGLIGHGLSTGQDLALPYTLTRLSGLDYAVFTNFARLAATPINLLFALGVAAFLIYRTLSRHRNKELIGKVALVSGMLITITASAHWLYTWENTYVGWDGYNAAYGLAAFFLMVGMLSRKVDAWSIRHPLLLALGDASFSIYLVHYGIQRFLISHFGIPSWLHLGLVYFALVFLAVACGLLFYRWVEAPLLELFGRGGARSRSKHQSQGGAA